METVEDIRNFLSNDIHNINCGGCGIAALTIYRWLKKNNQLKGDEKFVFLYNGESSFLNNSEVLKNNKGIPMACSHICLYSNGKYIDSNSIVSINKYKWVHHIDSEIFLLDAINNIDPWATWFNRCQVCEIAKKLNVNLSDIKIEA